MSYLIHDIEFTDIAGNRIKGMYHYDLSSIDHVIGKDKSRDRVKTGFPISITSSPIGKINISTSYSLNPHHPWDEMSSGFELPYR